MENSTHDDILETLEIHAVIRRPSAGGAWAGGHIAGHRFSALVFPEPAVNPAWEVVPGCRISKLSLKRLEDGAVVYNWDRGKDVATRSAEAARIVDALASSLADFVWGSTPVKTHAA